MGVYAAPDGFYPDRDPAWRRLQEGRVPVVAGYVKVPAGHPVLSRLGVYGQPSFEADWLAGNRGVRCFIWLDERTVSRSPRGVGAAGLPN